MATEPMPTREVDTPWGRLVAPTLDQYVGYSLLAYGEFSPDERRFLEVAITPDSVVLDVGANIGALTVPLSRAAKHVHAFEPQGPLADILEENVRRASPGNVTVHRCAVGAAPGQLRLDLVRYDRPNNFGGVSLGGQGPEVSVVTIDGLGLDRVDLIKIDVEGAELDVLNGAVEMITRWRPYLYVEADREHQVPKLLEWFGVHKYMSTWHEPPLYSPDNHAGNPFVAPHLRGAISINLWCCPA